MHCRLPVSKNTIAIELLIHPFLCTGSRHFLRSVTKACLLPSLPSLPPGPEWFHWSSRSPGGFPEARLVEIRRISQGRFHRTRENKA